jgi:hypothetical protein
MAGYSGTPLPKKLAIKAHSRLLLVNAPAGFAIDELPDGVVPHRRATRDPYDTILLFTSSRSAVIKGFPTAATRLTVAGGLWVCWPKKSSHVATDLSENVIRDIGLTEGLVDVKVCAIDETWSGLRFVRRLADRPRA